RFLIQTKRHTPAEDMVMPGWKKKRPLGISLRLRAGKCTIGRLGRKEAPSAQSLAEMGLFGFRFFAPYAALSTKLSCFRAQPRLSVGLWVCCCDPSGGVVFFRNVV